MRRVSHFYGVSFNFAKCFEQLFLVIETNKIEKNVY